MALGLISSENLDDFWSQNSRRKVFYSYPNGTAPLTALLSLADTESTPNPEPGWFEQRFEQLRTTTVAGPTSNTVFYLTGTTTTAGTTVAFAAGTTYRIYLTDSSWLQADDMIKIHYAPLSSGTTELSFRVLTTNVVGTDYVEAVYSGSGTSAAVTNNAATVVGLQVVHSGSAYAEAARSRTGRYKYPSEIKNFTQIFKTPFEMSRTALKEPTKYDKTGDYKNQLKGNGIDHMAALEWSAFFGDRRAETDTDPDTGSTVPRRFMGGLLWFLKQWELGSISNGGKFDYRTNATDVSTQTDYTTYPDKRIIRLASATVTQDQFEEIEGLAFRKTNNVEWCKLCLAGQGYLSKINSRYQKNIQVTKLPGDAMEKWDFKMYQRSSLAGDVYYKNHPLFNNVEMNNSAFYIDLGYLKYRPLDDSDTDIQQMIQLPDADKRKDQWLTEATIEFAYPEAHLFVDRLGGISL